MTKETGSFTIEAPVEKVFDFAKDIGKLWGSFPGIIVRDVHLTPDGAGSSVDWATKVLGVAVYQGHSEYTEVVPNERIRAKSDVMGGPTFLFTFEPTGEESTTVTVEGEYHFDVPVIGDQLDHLYAKLGGGSTAWSELAESMNQKIAGTAPPESGTLTRTIVIGVPVERAFTAALDLGKLWTYFPDVAVRDVKLTPEGVGSSVRIYSHALGLHMEGTGRIIEVVPNERIVVKAHFGPENPLWTFTFEPVESGTQLTVQGAWHVGFPRVGSAIEDRMAKSHTEFVEEMLAAIKADLEAAG